MKKLILLLSLLCFSVQLKAQMFSANLDAASTDCTVTRACLQAPLSTTPGIASASATITLSGTFSATVQYEVSADYGVTWTSVGSSTSTGATTVSVASNTNLRVRCSAYTSGTVGVTALVTTASTSSGGTPGGAANSVQYNNAGAFGGFGSWDGSTLTAPGNIHPSIVTGAQAEYLAYLDGSGTTLHDQSGHAYDCTFAGTNQPTWNYAGNGIVFSGYSAGTYKTSYLSCPSGMLSGAQTVQVFYTPTLPWVSDGVFNSAGYLIADSNNFGIDFLPSRLGIMSLAASATGETADAVSPMIGNMDFAFTCTTPASIYVNGSLGLGSLKSGNCPTFNAAGNSLIGTAATTAVYNFSGTLYAVLVYSSVLTAAQIKQNHDAVTALLAQHGVGQFVSPQPASVYIYEGDSRMANAGDSSRLVSSRPYLISQLVPDSRQFWNVGISSETMATIAGTPHLSAIDYPLLRAYPSASKTILLDASINDIAATASSTYTTVQGFCSSIHTAFPGTKVVFATTIGYSGLNAAKEAARESLNSSVVSGAIAGTFNCDGVDDIANDPILATQVTPNNYNPTAAGSSNTTWYASGIHETAAASREISTQEAFSVLAAQGRTNQCTVINKQIPYQVVTAANAATPGLTQTVTLLQLFPGWQVCSLSSHVTTAFSGTSISALHMTIGDSGGTATQYQSSVDLTATGTSVAAANTFTSASGIVQMNFTAVGANLTALSAGEVDIQIGVIVRP